MSAWAAPVSPAAMPSITVSSVAVHTLAYVAWHPSGSPFRGIWWRILLPVRRRSRTAALLPLRRHHRRLPGAKVRKDPLPKILRAAPGVVPDESGADHTPNGGSDR